MKRVEYLTALVISYFLGGILLSHYLSLKLDPSGNINEITGDKLFILTTIFVAVAVMPIVATWSRMVDAGRSKYLAFLIIVPIVTLYPLGVGLFTPSRYDRV
jgi:uncharacterized membrane protein YhaH (DUF805 family)